MVTTVETAINCHAERYTNPNVITCKDVDNYLTEFSTSFVDGKEY